LETKVFITLTKLAVDAAPKDQSEKSKSTCSDARP
jgi:hypothetical protein